MHYAPCGSCAGELRGKMRGDPRRLLGRPRRSRVHAVGLGHSRSYRWVVLAGAFFGVFGAVGLARFGYSAILPSMQEDLGITSAAAGSLASWNLGGYTIMAAVGGLLTTRLGARKVATTGLLTTAMGMVLTGLACDLLTASAARLITGLGNGMVLVPSLALMAAWFETRQLGLASSFVSSGASLALVLIGLTIPPIIASGGSDGWRLAWYFFAGATFCFAVLYGVFARNRPRPRERVALGDDPPPRSPRAEAGRISLGLKEVGRSGYAWHLGFIYLLYGFAFLIYVTFFQKRLGADLGYSGEYAGYLFLLVGLGGFVGAAPWGSVSDRIGRGRALALMFLIQAVAAALFAWVPTLPGVIVSAFILGLAAMGLPGVIGAGCGDQFGPALASTALGLVTIFTGVGMVLGPYFAGMLADTLGSLAYSYTLASGVFLVAAVLAFRLREVGWVAARTARQAANRSAEDEHVTLRTENESSWEA